MSNADVDVGKTVEKRVVSVLIPSVCAGVEEVPTSSVGNIVCIGVVSIVVKPSVVLTPMSVIFGDPSGLVIVTAKASSANRVISTGATILRDAIVAAGTS